MRERKGLRGHTGAAAPPPAAIDTRAGAPLACRAFQPWGLGDEPEGSMKLLRWSVLVVGILAATRVCSADDMKKEGGLYGLSLTSGTADLYDPSGAAGGYITAYDHSELGVAFQYWRHMSDDYAVAFNAGYGFFSEKDEPGTNAPGGSNDHKYTQTSWSVRVGGDRVEKLGERAVVYFGPGIEYWSGKAKFDDGTPGGSIETKNVTRVSLSTRIGALMTLSKGAGINLQLGHYIGMASAKDQGAKASWWPSGFQAAAGVVFRGP